MPRTQRLIVASLALVIGLGLGFFLSGFFDFQKLEPLEYEQYTPSVPLTASETEFKIALKTIVQVEQDVVGGGFTPAQLMSVFPRLIPEDFSGAAAVVGTYQFVDGQLRYSNTEVVDAAADNLSDEGIKTLRENIYRRLAIGEDRTTLEVMQLLRTEAVATSTPSIIPPATSAGTMCPEDARLCPDGSSVGRTGLECDFADCPGTSAVVTCTDEQRNMMCTQQYQPVCASYQVQCVTTPCNPVPKTYGNGCSACSDSNVISYGEGECAVPTE